MHGDVDVAVAGELYEFFAAAGARRRTGGAHSLSSMSLRSSESHPWARSRVEKVMTARCSWRSGITAKR